MCRGSRPMTSVNYYDLLRVSPKADAEIIQAAYRRLTLRHHPDRAPGYPDAERMMKALNATYEVLSDPECRRRYDADIAATSGNGSDPPSNEVAELSAAAKSVADRGDYRSAVGHFTEFINCGFTVAIVFYKRGGMYANLGDTKNALADFKRACDFDPRNEEFKSALK